MSSLEQLALRQSLRTAKSWRDTTLAALDQLHEAQQTIRNQQRQIMEMREERDRFARSVFHE